MCTWTLRRPPRHRHLRNRRDCANGRSSSRASGSRAPRSSCSSGAATTRRPSPRSQLAADVSERTVFTYFPTKEDILFSDHADFRDRLALALAARTPGASALDTLRDFVVENLGAIDESSRVRWEIVSHDEHLLSHQRARQGELGDVIATAVAAELGADADEFRLQLVTSTVVAAVMAVYEHRTSVRSKTASRAQALAVIDEAIAFLRGGLEAIRAFPKPY